jgi:hypothetical protein
MGPHGDDDDSTDGTGSRETVTAHSPQQQLPQGWTTSVSSGEIYYVNQLTGKSTYDRPAAPATHGTSLGTPPRGWPTASHPSPGIFSPPVCLLVCCHLLLHGAHTTAGTHPQIGSLTPTRVPVRVSGMTALMNAACHRRHHDATAAFWVGRSVCKPPPPAQREDDLWRGGTRCELCHGRRRCLPLPCQHQERRRP